MLLSPQKTVHGHTLHPELPLILSVPLKCMIVPNVALGGMGQIPKDNMNLTARLVLILPGNHSLHALGIPARRWVHYACSSSLSTVVIIGLHQWINSSSKVLSRSSSGYQRLSRSKRWWWRDWRAWRRSKWILGLVITCQKPNGLRKTTYNPCILRPLCQPLC